MKIYRLKIINGLVLVLCGISIISCSWKPVKRIQSVGYIYESPTRSDREMTCFDSEYYIPWDGETGTTPMRTIRLNIHIMNSRDGSKNLQGQAALQFVEDLISTANEDLDHNQPMRLPLYNKTPVLDPLVRYQIVKKEDGSPAIYMHFDDEYYYLVKKGPYRNNYDRSVIDKYGIGLDSILNVFIQTPPPDSLMTDDYGGLKTGVALQNGIRISGPFLTDSRVWTYSGMFNHEVGHILGLRHSWLPDQCDDTPEHTNCWNFTNDGSVCDSLVSNNVMDSNADQDAMTPCQIGIMQRSLTQQHRTQRAYQDHDFCERQIKKPIRISDTVTWCREMDIVSDIVIEKNSQLVIRNRVSMPRGGRIYIEKGGQLVLRRKAVVQNACGLPWHGIYSRKPMEDRVVKEDGAVLIVND